MKLPFSQQQFLEVFAAYNQAAWPFVLILWLATVAIFIRLLRVKHGSRGVAALLAVHWAWAGAVYHALFFTSINPAARLFAELFVLQALLLAGAGVVGSRLRFRIDRGPWSWAAVALIGYALLYPFLAMGAGHGVLRSPWFGVPCPTTLLTAGLLLAADPPVRWLFIVPVFWSLLAGLSSLQLGMPPDFALLPAAALLAIRALLPALPRHEVPRTGPRPAAT